VGDAVRVGVGDVKAMLALARPIADERCRGAKANQIAAYWHELGGACPHAPCHRDGCLSAASLGRGKPEECRQR